MEGQITLTEWLSEKSGNLGECPYEPGKHCENAESCKEFKELYGFRDRDDTNQRYINPPYRA